MSMANIKKDNDQPFQSVVPPFLHQSHLVYYQWHPVLVEPSPVHAQPVDGFAPPFEQWLLLLRELRVI
jgi:hypothetical protein